MRIQATRVTCLDCQKVSDVDLVVECPIAVAAASMKAARCPHCSGGKLGFGGELSDGKPSASSPLPLRAQWWLDSGAVGLSSRTIYGVFTGNMPRELTVPLDPDDFSRIKKLFDLIPEWRADIGRLKAALPWYGPLVDNWERLEALFDEEDRRGWKPPYVMYKFMHPLVEECRKLQRGGAR